MAAVIVFTKMYNGVEFSVSQGGGVKVNHELLNERNKWFIMPQIEALRPCGLTTEQVDEIANEVAKGKMKKSLDRQVAQEQQKAADSLQAVLEYAERTGIDFNSLLAKKKAQ